MTTYDPNCPVSDVEQTRYAMTKSVTDELTILGYSPMNSPACYPERPYYVELNSGLRHWFETDKQAKASQYWPV